MHEADTPLHNAKAPCVLTTLEAVENIFPPGLAIPGEPTCMRVFITSNGCNVAEAMRPADAPPTKEDGFQPLLLFLLLVVSSSFFPFLIFFAVDDDDEGDVGDIFLLREREKERKRRWGAKCDKNVAKLTRDMIFFSNAKKTDR